VNGSGDVLFLPATDEWDRWNRVIWDRLPQLRLSPEEKALLGPLAFATSTSDSGIDILAGLVDCVEKKLLRDLYSSSPVVRAKALIAISWAYEFLIRAGYKEDFTPLLNGLLTGFTKIAETVRRVMVRKLISTTDDEEAEQIMQFLVEFLERGAWPSHEKEFSRLQALVRAVEDRSSPPLMVS
jgi:hypothetical protein